MFSNIYIKPKITYVDVNLKGSYNIYSRTLVINPLISNFRPDVSVDVDENIVPKKHKRPTVVIQFTYYF